MGETRKNKVIPLNIVMTYPVRWDKYKVIRDFQQNFYDTVGFEHWKDRFEYKYENKTLSMWINGIDMLAYDLKIKDWQNIS